MHPSYMILAAIFALFVTISVGSVVLDAKRLRQLLAERAGESICTFARSFPRAGTDFRIVRAVAESVSEWVAGDPKRLPVRADDSFVRTFNMDFDDVEDMVAEIASRCGRTLAGAERNPYYGHVETLRDLVRFLNEQPMQDAA